MPIGYPKSLLAVVGPLRGDLDAGDGFSGLQDRADNFFNRRCERRHAFPDGAAEMAIDRDPADFSQTLVYVNIAAVRREECETDRGCIVDQLQRRLGKLQDTLQRQLSLIFASGQL